MSYLDDDNVKTLTFVIVSISFIHYIISLYTLLWYLQNLTLHDFLFYSPTVKNWYKCNLLYTKLTI